MEDGCHDGYIEEVIHLPLSGREELRIMMSTYSFGTEYGWLYLLAKRILLRLGDSVVVVEGLLEGGWWYANFLGKRLTTIEALHETTTDVVLAVPFDLGGCLTVEHKTDGIL